MSKPSKVPEWDTTQVNSIEPDATHKAEGWLAPGGVPEKPPFQTFNYWQNEVYRWLDFIDGTIQNTFFISSYGSLADAVTAIGATPGLLVIDVPDIMSANVSIPFTLGLKFIPGNTITTTGYTLTINTPSQMRNADRRLYFAGTGSVEFTNKGIVRPDWFAGGIADAITSLTGGGSILFGNGTYNLSSGIAETLLGNHVWITEGLTTIKYTGSEITDMVSLTLNGNTMYMYGPIIFDANQDARRALFLDNDTGSMATAVDVFMKEIEGKNAYSTDTVTNIGSNGILIYGGYNKVSLVNCSAVNISRAAGVGDPGVTGSKGISVQQADSDAYPRQVEIINPYIDTVTSLEPDLGANNFDCDGLVAFGPTASGGIKYNTTLFVSGGKFINCRGRSIKSQMENNMILAPNFERNADADRTITDGIEVDFQLGSGILRDYKCSYIPRSGGGTPFGGSFSIVKALAPDDANNEGIVIIDGGEIKNDVPTGTDDLPYLFIPSAAGTGQLQSVTITNNSFIGDGRLGSCVFGDIGLIVNLITKDNFFNQLSSSLVFTNANAEDCNWVAVNNRVGFSANGVLWTASSGNPPTLVEVHGNQYFNDVIYPTGGEAVRLDDDATHTFARQVNPAVYGIYFLTTDVNENALSVFGHSGTAQDLTGGAATEITLGDAANPDVDNQVNVWKDANNRINIKNRMGSTRTFSLSAK